MDENAAIPPSNRPSRSPSLVNDTTGIRAANRRSHASQPRSFGPWRALQSMFSVALLVATLFTLLTPDNLNANHLINSMFNAVPSSADRASIPTATTSPRPHIGLVSGHWGNDSGSTCPDGLTEAEVNLKIATLVKEILTKEGYQVDLLKEFDNQLREYKALALVSIHNDSCDFINDQATGFKVAAAKSSLFPEKSMRLTACLSQRYQKITGLPFHYNTVTRDMTEYHAFSEIHSDTTAAIIETGFLNLDRDILTNHTDIIAQGVASGILCFVRNEDVPDAQVIPTAQP